MGSVVAMDLSKQSRNDIEIGVGDIDYGRAESVAGRYENAKAFKVDVTKTDELAKILKRYDAVVNASWFEHNLHVMKACFSAHCNYNDLGGLFHMTKQQLSLNGEAKKAGVTAIVGGGESPGITNVMARYCSESLETLDSVSVFAGSKEVPKSSLNHRVIFPFSVSTVIDEYSKKAVEFLNGKFVEVPPLSGTEEVNFPNPVGRNTVHYSIHSEPATLPYTLGKGVRNVTFKLGSSKAMFDMLANMISMGFTSEEKIPVNGSSISPKEFLVSFFNNKYDANLESGRYVSLRTVAIGTRNGKRAKVQADLVCGPRGKNGPSNATAFLTGVAGSIFGQFLANGGIIEDGVVAPESAVDTRLFFNELDKRGIQVRKRDC